MRTALKIQRLNYELGYDLNYSAASGQRIADKTKSIGDYAVFASAEIQPLKGVLIRPGIRAAYNTAYKSPLTPSFNFKYNTGTFTLRASYARGFRAPDLKELYFEFVDINHNIAGNTNLKAERSDNYNLSLRMAGKKNTSDYSVDLSGFYSTIRELITLALVSGSEYSYINIGKFVSYGSSLSASIKNNFWSFSAGASLTARYNDLSREFHNLAEFSYTPEYRASIQYKMRRSGTALNCFYKFSGRLPDTARTMPEMCRKLL